jgi:hypothetical protein
MNDEAGMTNGVICNWFKSLQKADDRVQKERRIQQPATKPTRNKKAEKSSGRIINNQ